jgi:Domain of unknown function (DUF5658)
VGATVTARRVGRRLSTVPLAWLVATFSIAQLADLVSALVVAHELNPIASTLVERPLLAFALKIALIAFVVAVAEICDRERPLVARFVLVIGALAGLIGALSNTHLTPFLSA